MFNSFNSLSTYLQVVTVISMIATLLLIVQLIIMLIGIDSETDFDFSSPDDISIFDIFGFKLLTIRNIIAFFAIGGWTFIIVQGFTDSYLLSNIAGVLAGLITMFLLTMAMNSIMKLQQNGVKIMQNAVGKTGTVYLTIPGERSGFGKVNVLIQETLVEYEAKSDEEIVTGCEVVVNEVVNDYLIVSKK